MKFTLVMIFCVFICVVDLLNTEVVEAEIPTTMSKYDVVRDLPAPKVKRIILIARSLCWDSTGRLKDVCEGINL